mmetsp:Transcript_52790/g.86704  ORF Transcript_52790/g.86704 Transcript_52790/m.86704 type:complete len:95 (+) Transcript_52790:1326-1610(+)
MNLGSGGSSRGDQFAATVRPAVALATTQRHRCARASRFFFLWQAPKKAKQEASNSLLPLRGSLKPPMCQGVGFEVALNRKNAPYDAAHGRKGKP